MERMKAPKPTAAAVATPRSPWADPQPAGEASTSAAANALGLPAGLFAAAAAAAGANDAEANEALAILQRFSQLGDTSSSSSSSPQQQQQEDQEEEWATGLLSSLTSQNAAEQAEFDVWMQQMLQQQQQQQGAGEELDLLSQAAAAEQQVGDLLSQANMDFATLSSLLRQTLGSGKAGAEEAELEAAVVQAGGEDASEEQVLAQLRASNPKLYALLGPDDGLQFGAEEEQLVAAIESLSRMGLAGPNGGPNGSTDPQQQQQQGGGGAEDEADDAQRMWEGLLQGLDMEGGKSGAAVQAAGGAAVQEEEEELSDAELARLAREDPDLAALLKSSTLGKDFERIMADEGLDLEGEGLGEEDEEEPELSDLFDAIDEDPELDDADRSRAKAELQGIFNMGGSRGAAADDAAEGQRRASSTSWNNGLSDVLKGATTTGYGRKQAQGGDEGAGGEAAPSLLPRPKPRAS